MKSVLLIFSIAATAAFWSSPFGKLEDPAAASKLELVGLAIHNDGSIDGAVANRSDTAIDDVDLVVSHTFSWSDERHPGEDDPGRASHVRVAGVIASQASLSFSYVPVPSLPARSDGSFTTTVAVQSFREVRN